MKNIRYFTIALIFLLTTPVFATLPVIDATQIANTISLIEQAKSQYDMLKGISDLNNKANSLLQANLSGNFGYGNLLNDAAALKDRLWSNDHWVDVLNESSNGNSAFNAAQKKYDQLYPVRPANEIVSTRNRDNLTRTYYQN